MATEGTRGGRLATWLVLAHAAALWPVARWYVLRFGESDGDAWGLAALAAVVVLAAAAPRPARAAGIGLASVLLLGYAVLSPFVPPLAAAALGVASLAALVSAARYGTPMQPALLALLLASLPSVSTLQYFVGWPLRVAVAAVVAPLLSVVGIGASAEGTSLVVGGRAVEVDAPCSGVWLLWGAVVLWFAVALARRLPAGATLRGLLAVLAVVLAANALRTASLVLVEVTRGVPSWAHGAVGLLVLAAALVAVVLLSERFARCAPRSAT